MPTTALLLGALPPAAQAAGGWLGLVGIMAIVIIALKRKGPDWPLIVATAVTILVLRESSLAGPIIEQVAGAILQTVVTLVGAL